MRALIAVLALAVLAGCDASVESSGGDNASSSSGGYTLEIRADAAQQTYLITTPDGRTVGARAAEGASALMDTSRAQALAGEPPPQGSDELPEVVAMRLPGFEMSVSGNDEDKSGENGRVALSIGGGEQNIVVHADEGGPGEADDTAYVRITGADEAAVRDFVRDAEELSPEVKTELLAALSLQ
ncbi:MAG: hypothetical protein U1E03_04465 [Hyphomonadaceae bacterium]